MSGSDHPSEPPPAYSEVTDLRTTPSTQPQPHYGSYTTPSPQPYSNPTANRGYTRHHDEEESTFNASSFSDKVVRNRFIRKVYLILMVQMTFTAGVVALFVLQESVRLWVQKNVWFYVLAYITFFVTYIVLACCPTVRRKYPGNYIALTVFTVTFAYVCAAIASFNSAQAVLIAAGITAAVSLAISLFAIQTKIDFTMCTGLIFALSMTLLFAGVAFMFVAIFLQGEPRNLYILQVVYGSIAALIISIFLVYDTQRIVGGSNRAYALSPEEHIIGAMELYLDIVYIFLLILSCMRSSR